MNTENIQNNCNTPNEEYTFTYSLDELKNIFKKTNRINYRPSIILISAIVFWLVICSVLDPQGENTGILIGFLILYSLLFFKGVYTNRRAQKESVVRVSSSVYNYKVFQHYFILTIHRYGEKMLEQKIYFCDVKNFTDLGNHYIFQSQSWIHILKKDTLQSNSIFYTLRRKKK